MHLRRSLSHFPSRYKYNIEHRVSKICKIEQDLDIRFLLQFPGCAENDESRKSSRAGARMQRLLYLQLQLRYSKF